MQFDKIKEDDNKYIVNTYARYDIAVERAKGATVYGSDGMRYIDMAAGIGVNSLGYGDSGYIEAVTEQLEKYQHISNLFYSKPGIDLARKLVTKTGMSKVIFVNSGAEANETAFKLVRKYGNVVSQKKRNNIVSLVNSFHGRTIAAVTATGQERPHRGFDPLAPGFVYAKPNDIDTFKMAVLQKDPVAVIIELVQGEGGVNALSKDYVKELFSICRKRDIAVIADEVQTGIGRTGTLFAYEQYGVQPDIVTFAKGIGGGLPIGGVIVNEKFSGVLKPGDHGSTFGMNPVACAAANYVIDQMTSSFLEGVKGKASHIRERLEEIPEVERTTGLGLMIGIVLRSMDAADTATSLLENGVLVLTAKDKIRLLPPLTISYPEIDRAMEVFEKVLMH